MVERQQRRPLRLLRKAFFMPSRTILAEAAAVTIDLEGVQHQHPHRVVLDRILKKAGRPRNLSKDIKEGSAAVVVSKAEVSRDWIVLERALQLPIGVLVLPLVGQVPRHEQKVRAGLGRAQM